MDMTLVYIIAVGLLVNPILSFLKEVLIGLTVNEDRDFDERLAILDELNKANWREDKMFPELSIMFLPYSQGLNIMITAYELGVFLKQNPDKDGLDYSIEEAKRRKNKLKKC